MIDKNRFNAVKELLSSTHLTFGDIAKRTNTYLDTVKLIADGQHPYQTGKCGGVAKPRTSSREGLGPRVTGAKGYMPSPDEIAEKCAIIRAARAAAGDDEQDGWTPPLYSTSCFRK